MKVKLLSALNDANVDAVAASSQRQLGISISAIAGELDSNVPLNLCLILDKSGSMSGTAINTVKQAVERLLDQLKPGDRISVVTFDDSAQVLIPNQVIENRDRLKAQIASQLEADGGTAIAEGLRLGIKELTKEIVGKLFPTHFCLQTVTVKVLCEFGSGSLGRMIINAVWNLRFWLQTLI